VFILFILYIHVKKFLPVLVCGTAVLTGEIPASRRFGGWLREKKLSHVRHVDIGAQAHVVRKVQTRVIRIFIDYDFVVRPVPPVAKAVVGGEDAEPKTAKPKTLSASARQMPNMAWPEAGREPSMFPRMIDMVGLVVLAGVMADPLAILANALLSGRTVWRRGGLPVKCFRTPGRNMFLRSRRACLGVFFRTLSESCKGN
jgi:hypothetical protein